MADNERKAYPFFGFAKGHYSNICCLCKNDFIGDKRSVVCLECAIIESYKVSNNLQFKIIELEKRKKEFEEALNDISNWNDELETQWDDVGQRALEALKPTPPNKGGDDETT